MGWTQQEAADQLDISKRQIVRYEKGINESDGRPAPVPRVVSLACEALEARRAWGAVAAYYSQ